MAPRIEPGIEPSPPMTTIENNRRLLSTSNASVARPWEITTYSEPANPANPPESANATSFVRVGAIVTDCAANSLSRTAMIARPVRADAHIAHRRDCDDQ